MTVEVGKPIPDFSAPLTGDKTFHLKDFIGENLVIYFYPRDSTPGCTQEGLDFQALLDEFAKHNTMVFGLSRDTLRKHENFREKQGYTFDLISDTSEEVCNIFDVIRDKKMYGKDVRGIERSTFLIDKDGKLVMEWRKLKIAGHAQAVLEAVQAVDSTN
jgi:peroxiredoxin Q/BCP